MSTVCGRGLPLAAAAETQELGVSGMS
eukprot:COSAG04_NODE_28056_length_278_cov_0.581006_1_plen_26_part_10